MLRALRWNYRRELELAARAKDALAAGQVPR